MVFDDEDKKMCRENGSLGAKIDSKCQYYPGLNETVYSLKGNKNLVSWEVPNISLKIRYFGKPQDYNK